MENPDTLSAAALALSVDRLSHSYGPRKALDDVSFAVRPASFHLDEVMQKRVPKQ